MFTGGISYSCSVQLSAYLTNVGYPKWYFLCPKQTSKKCVKRVAYLYLGRDGIFSCAWCADAVQENWMRSGSKWYDGWFSDPQKLIDILSSPYAPVKHKLKALEISQRLIHMRKQREKKKLKKEKRRLKRLREARTEAPRNQLLHNQPPKNSSSFPRIEGEENSRPQ